MRVGPRSVSPITPTRAGALARTYSSLKITCCARVAPRPPCSFGQPRHVHPARPSTRSHSRLTSKPSCSWPGPPRPSSAANSPTLCSISQPRTSRRKASSSSLKRRSMGVGDVSIGLLKLVLVVHHAPGPHTAAGVRRTVHTVEADAPADVNAIVLAWCGDENACDPEALSGDPRVVGYRVEERVTRTTRAPAPSRALAICAERRWRRGRRAVHRRGRRLAGGHAEFFASSHPLIISVNRLGL